MIESFLEYLSLEKKYAVHTITAYKTDLLAFKDFIETEYKVVDLTEVHYPQIRTWIVALVNQKISNTTINRKISSLKSFYKFLQKTEQIEKNPLLKHKSLKTPKKVQVPFTVKEISNAIDINTEENNFTSLRNKLLIELLYSTGIRRTELINLKDRDINVAERTIKVLGKRNKERYVPLLATVIQTLKGYQKEKNKISVKSEYLFITSKGNKIYETLVYRIINSYFSRVSEKVKKSPHILRHSFATHLLNEGADLNSVKELLGHSSLASTQVYTHNSLDAIKKVYNQAHPKSVKKRWRMKVFTQSVNFNADSKLIDFVEIKVSTLSKFHDKIVDAEVFLKVQNTSDKENKITEVKINIPGKELIIKRETKTFEEGVNSAVDNLKRQLKRSKEKHRDSLIS